MTTEQEKKAAKAAAQKRWYEKNKQQHIANAGVRKKKAVEDAREYVRAIKENSGCVDCKKSYPYYVLQFDHLSDKAYTIADMILSGYSIKTIQKEIDKCDIVCANCHMFRTHKRRI